MNFNNHQFCDSDQLFEPINLESNYNFGESQYITSLINQNNRSNRPTSLNIQKRFPTSDANPELINGDGTQRSIFVTADHDISKVVNKKKRLPLASDTKADDNYHAVIVHEPKPRIPRPPNAFMIFANEWRKQLASKYSNESNKDISKRLGQMWKHLDEPTKECYFVSARKIDAEHKKKYPDYVYNPKEARIRKALRDSWREKEKKPIQLNNMHKDNLGSAPIRVILPMPTIQFKPEITFNFPGDNSKRSYCNSWFQPEHNLQHSLRSLQSAAKTSNYLIPRCNSAFLSQNIPNKSTRKYPVHVLSPKRETVYADVHKPAVSEGENMIVLKSSKVGVSDVMIGTEMEKVGFQNPNNIFSAESHTFPSFTINTTQTNHNLGTHGTWIQQPTTADYFSHLNNLEDSFNNPFQLIQSSEVKEENKHGTVFEGVKLEQSSFSTAQKNELFEVAEVKPEKLELKTHYSQSVSTNFKEEITKDTLMRDLDWFNLPFSGLEDFDDEIVDEILRDESHV